MAKQSYPNIYWREQTAWLETVVDGKRYRESLHTANINLAMQRRDIRMVELREGKVNESAAWQTPGDYANRGRISWHQMRDFDMDRARLVSSESVVRTGVGTSWERLRNTFPDAHSVTNDALASYARIQRDNGYSAATIRRDLWAIMRGYEWAQEQLPELPTFKRRLKLTDSPPGKAQGQYIGPSYLATMARILKPKPAAVLIFFVATGMRSEEFNRMSLKWVRKAMVNNELRTFIDIPKFNGAKWRKARTIPLPRWLLPLLPTVVAAKTNYRKAWATAAASIQLARCSRRDLRKTFATEMAPFDVYGVDLVMGHTSSGQVSHRYQAAHDDRLIILADKIAPYMSWIVPAAERVASALQALPQSSAPTRIPTPPF